MLQKIIVSLMVLLDIRTLSAFALSKFGLVFFPVVLGLAATLGFAPYGMWPVTFASLVLIAVYAVKVSSKKQLFLVIFLFFMALNAVTLHWLNFVMQGFGEMPFIASEAMTLLLCAYLSLPYSLLSVLGLKLFKNHRIVFVSCIVPLAFICSDFIVSYLMTGFPWMLLGYTAIEGPFASFAPLAGVRGVSALLVICACLTGVAATRRYLFLPPAAVIFLMGIFLTGINYTEESEQLDFSLVQGNIKQELKWNNDEVDKIIATYWTLSKSEFQKNRIVVWPESALPIFMNNAIPLLSDLNSAAFSKDSLLVMGIQRYDSERSIFNTMAVFGQNDSIDSIKFYDKQNLVPFGEFVPFADLLRPLGKFFNIPMSNFSKPKNPERTPLDIGTHKFTPIICYDSIFPEHALNRNTEESEGLLMISNDSWFGPTRGPLQHLAISRMRALEYQKPVIRSTNSGYTVIINEDGIVEAEIAKDQEGVLRHTVRTFKGLTPYAAYGNIPVTVIMLLLAVCALVCASRGPGSRQREALEHLVRP